MAGKQNKNKKFGRGKRAPTHSQQTMRTERNKRKRTERAKKLASTPKKMRVPRGTARAKRRKGLSVLSRSMETVA